MHHIVKEREKHKIKCRPMIYIDLINFNGLKSPTKRILDWIRKKNKPCYMVYRKHENEIIQ